MIIDCGDVSIEGFVHLSAAEGPITCSRAILPFLYYQWTCQFVTPDTLHNNLSPFPTLTTHSSITLKMCKVLGKACLKASPVRLYCPTYELDRPNLGNE